MVAGSSKPKRITTVNVLIVLFLIGSAVCLLIGLLALLRGTGALIYALQNLVFGAVLAVSAYSLYNGTRRIWWLTIVSYILVGMAVSAYFAYWQGQILSLAKILIYAVILAYMVRPRVRNWFGV